MANQVSNVSFTNPDEMELQRRRAMAQALQSESMKPMEQQTAGGWVIPNSPWQGAAKLAQAYAGNMAQTRAQELAKGMQEKQQATRGADMSLLVNALAGRQASPGGLTEDAAGNVTRSDPMQAMSPVQGLGQALPMMQDPQMQQMGMQALFGAQQRGDQQDFQRQQLQMQQAHQSQERSLADQRARERQTSNAELQRELVQMRADVGGDRPFFQFLPSSTGYMAGNARTGQVQPVMHNDRQVVPAAQDPSLQGQIAQNKAGGKERGEAQAQAQMDMPRVIDNATNSLQLIDQMIGSEDRKSKEHPGFRTSVGMGLGPLTKRVPGTDAAGFHALLDQVKGGAFLEAFNSLKGGGQITEVEGKKATDAITRMQTATKETEFVKAAREYQGIIRKGVERAQTKAGGKYSGPDRRGVPQGVDPALWSVMTPEEKALWAQ